jgi:hypothetical protein
MVGSWKRQKSLFSRVYNCEMTVLFCVAEEP